MGCLEYGQPLLLVYLSLSFLTSNDQGLVGGVSPNSTGVITLLPTPKRIC